MSQIIEPNKPFMMHFVVEIIHTVANYRYDVSAIALLSLYVNVIYMVSVLIVRS